MERREKVRVLVQDPLLWGVGLAGILILATLSVAAPPSVLDDPQALAAPDKQFMNGIGELEHELAEVLEGLHAAPWDKNLRAASEHLQARLDELEAEVVRLRTRVSLGAKSVPAVPAG